ncbi:CRISPR-associated DxTHG motif protein [uncultured Dysgonomonas sp.]
MAPTPREVTLDTTHSLRSPLR